MIADTQHEPRGRANTVSTAVPRSEVSLTYCLNHNIDVVG